jgi:hypothetical protein
VFGCIEALPSSSRLTATFAPQLLLPTCRAISASPPPHIIALHVIALHGYSSSSCCRARIRLGLAVSQIPPRSSLPRYCRARPRCPSCGSVPSRHASPPFAHTRTARVLGPHRAAAHASESALRAIACSGPPKTCTHYQLPRVTARTLARPARRRPRSCRSSTCTGSPTHELLHRLSHVAPAPVLA